MASRADRGGDYDVAGAGWLTFAGVMLTMVGFFNVINGIAAIGDSKYLVNQVLFSNLHAWGWFMLIWGSSRSAPASRSSEARRGPRRLE